MSFPRINILRSNHGLIIAHAARLCKRTVLRIYEDFPKRSCLLDADSFSRPGLLRQIRGISGGVPAEFSVILPKSYTVCLFKYRLPVKTANSAITARYKTGRYWYAGKCRPQMVSRQ